MPIFQLWNLVAATWMDDFQDAGDTMGKFGDAMNSMWDDMFMGKPIDHNVNISIPDAPDIQELKEEQTKLVQLIETEFHRTQELNKYMNILENKRANDPLFGAQKKKRIVTPKDKELKAIADSKKRPSIVILDSPELSNIDVKEYMAYLSCTKALQQTATNKEQSKDIKTYVQNLERIRANFAKELSQINILQRDIQNIFEKTGSATSDQMIAAISATKLQIANLRSRLIDMAVGRKPAPRIAKNGIEKFFPKKESDKKPFGARRPEDFGDDAHLSGGDNTFAKPEDIDRTPSIKTETEETDE